MGEISIWQIIFLIIFSGFISVDRFAGLNIMISRPIIVSGIIGIVFNDIYAALMIGLIFEFIGMLEVPVGTTIVHDDSFGGYAGASAVLIGYVSPDAFNILTVIFIVSLLIYPVTLSDKWFREINRYLVQKSVVNNKAGNENELIALGIFLAFVRGVIVYNAGLIIVLIFINIMNNFEIYFTDLYKPVVALIIIAAFMSGYLLRFLIINRIYKVLLLALVIAAGWWII